MLATIWECKDSGGNDDNGIDISMDGFQEPLKKALAVFQANSAEYEDAFPGKSIAEIRRIVEIIVNDTLVRIDALSPNTIARGHRKTGLFAQVWSSESIVALEKHVSWLRAESQRPWDAGPSGSRTLWTGPLQRQQYSNVAAESEGVGILAVETINPDLVTGINETLFNPDKTELVQECILERLTLTNIKAREDEVSKAHSETFQWGFAAKKDTRFASSMDNNDFVVWLSNENESRIYWINGKAGSGKSTLMRFIVKHEQTLKHLEQWAGNTPLSLITFFFWTSGSILQRSQTGLLRSLLFQLLDQRRDLIPWTFPELWMVCQDTKNRV